MSNFETWSAIILAAGQGTRMKSDQPKVLHPIAGRPLVSWVVQSALQAGATHCVVVVGHGREAVERELKSRFGNRVQTVVQSEQRGTGHAVQCALEGVNGLGQRVLILYGDCPLIPHSLMRDLVDQTSRAEAQVGLVTAKIDDPRGYGRILRGRDGSVSGIREHRDCSAEELRISEINPGLYAIRTDFLEQAIRNLSTDNAQGELYLTDIVEMAANDGTVVDVAGDIDELQGINDRLDLAICATRARRRIAEELARRGVGFAEIDSVHIDLDTEIEPGAYIGPNVHLRGKCVVREGAFIDAGCVLTDTEVDSHAVLLPYTIATESIIGPGAQVGPFAHLRPRSELGARSKVGNFSETKQTKLGEGSKVNHLSYVGNGVIGRDVNIGAGTIFCNYDGERKHTTVLEDEVFIGSDSQLIAPVTVKKGAYVASGSTITRDVPEDALALSRSNQENKEGYAGRLRARLRRSKDEE